MSKYSKTTKPSNFNRGNDGWKFQQKQRAHNRETIGKHQNFLQDEAQKFWESVRLGMSETKLEEVKQMVSLGSLDKLSGEGMQQFSEWSKDFARQLSHSSTRFNPAVSSDLSKAASMTLFAVITASLLTRTSAQQPTTFSPTPQITTFTPSVNNTNGTTPFDDSVPVFKKPEFIYPVAALGGGIIGTAAVVAAHKPKPKIIGANQDEVQRRLAAEKDASLILVRNLVKAIVADLPKDKANSLQMKTMANLAESLVSVILQQHRKPEKKSEYTESAVLLAHEFLQKVNIKEGKFHQLKPRLAEKASLANHDTKDHNLDFDSAKELQKLCEELSEHCKNEDVKTTANTIVTYLTKTIVIEKKSDLNGLPNLPLEGAAEIGEKKASEDEKKASDSSIVEADLSLKPKRNSSSGSIFDQLKDNFDQLKDKFKRSPTKPAAEALGKVEMEPLVNEAGSDSSSISSIPPQPANKAMGWLKKFTNSNSSFPKAEAGHDQEQPHASSASVEIEVSSLKSSGAGAAYSALPSPSPKIFNSSSVASSLKPNSKGSVQH